MLSTMDQKPILIARKNDAGQRLDNFLLKHRKQLDRSTLYKLIRKGQIRVNGKRVKPLFKLSADDQVRMPPHVFFVETKVASVTVDQQQSLLACIIAEDEDFVVLDKPAGWPVHAGTGHDVGVVEVLASMEQYQDIQLAHRLDKDTSGCLLLAKSRQGLLVFQQALKSQQVDKDYVAILNGVLNQVTQVEQPLDTSHRVDGKRTVIVSQQGKSALTTFSPIKHHGKLTWVNCSIVSGRTHQIRVHAKHLGLPILGDALYGNAQPELARALYLHAASLRFLDYHFTAPLPAAFDEIIN